MDKKELWQYISIRTEAREVAARIASLTAEISDMEKSGAIESDVVTCGKRGKKALGTVKVTGFPDAKYQDKLQRLRNSRRRNALLLAEIDEKAAAVETYICGIDDQEVRRILRLKCLGDVALTWAQVAHKMGGLYTADSCRMIVKRYLRK